MAQRRSSSSLLEMPFAARSNSTSVLPITTPPTAQSSIRGIVRVGCMVAVLVVTLVLVQQLSLVGTAGASSSAKLHHASSADQGRRWECPPCATTVAAGAGANGEGREGDGCPENTCLMRVAMPRPYGVASIFHSHALLAAAANPESGAAAAAPQLQPPCTDSDTGRYLSFRPQPGLDAFMAELPDALILARRLRRTLIVPRLRLAAAGLRFNESASANVNAAAAAADQPISSSTMRQLLAEPGSVELASVVSLSPLAKLVTVLSSDSFAARLVSNLTDANVMALSEDANSLNFLVASHDIAATTRPARLRLPSFVENIRTPISSHQQQQKQTQQKSFNLGGSTSSGAGSASASSSSAEAEAATAGAGAAVTTARAQVRLVGIDELDRTACKVSLLMFDSLRGRLLDVPAEEAAEAEAAVNALFSRELLASLGVRTKARRISEQLGGPFRYAMVLMRTLPGLTAGAEGAAETQEPRAADSQQPSPASAAASAAAAAADASIEAIVAWAERLRANIRSPQMCLLKSLFFRRLNEEDKCLAGPAPIPIYLAAPEGSALLARLKTRLTRLGFRPVTLADLDPSLSAADATQQPTLLELALLDLSLAADAASLFSNTDAISAQSPTHGVASFRRSLL